MSEGRFIEGSDSWLIPTHKSGKNNQDVTKMTHPWSSTTLNFPTFPTVLFELFPNLDDIEFNVPQFTAIQPGQLRDLRIFWSVWGHLEIIHPNTFIECFSMRRLLLMRQRIREVSRTAFLGLVNLEELSLAVQPLSFLHFETFYYTPSLKFLDLSINHLTTFTELIAPLASLERFHIYHNYIRDIPLNAFDRVRNLRELFIYDNPVTNFDSSALRNFNQLSELGISNLSIDHLAIPICPNVITASFNKIEILHANLFPQGSRIQELRVDNNGIRAIDPLLFENIQFGILQIGNNPCVLPNVPGGRFNINFDSNQLRTILPYFEKCFNDFKAQN
jgi:Leucine-rich repeat (LRR) protein